MVSHQTSGDINVMYESKINQQTKEVINDQDDDIVDYEAGFETVMEKKPQDTCKGDQDDEVCSTVDGKMFEIKRVHPLNKIQNFLRENDLESKESKYSHNAANHTPELQGPKIRRFVNKEFFKQYTDNIHITHRIKN